MGRSSLVKLGLAITFLSLISVDSTQLDQVEAAQAATIRIVELKYLTTLNTNLTATRCKLSQFYLHHLTENSTLKFAPVFGIIGQALVFVYCCLSIGALCDQHFVPSLEQLGNYFSWSPKVTSAFLIPFATSGPEIFASLIGVFVAENDIGTGSIIGSSLYNLVAIPAVCGVAAVYFFGKSLKIEAEPVLKDLLFYIIAIIGLIFTIKDQNVDLMETSLLIVLFSIYVGTKIFNQESDNDDENNNCKTVVNDNIPEEVDDDDDGNDGLMSNKYIRALLIPMLSMYHLTIPKSFPILSFMMSAFWLSILSYVSVWAITGVSESLAIPTTIAGMTILAAGSAVPDMVTSVIVMKNNGQASLGIGTAISANIIAVLFGLGFPWFLKCLLSQLTTGQSSFVIQSESLPFTCMLLLVATFAMILGLNNCQFKMGNKLSTICFIIQLVFTVSVIGLELSYDKILS